jgi:hypothetical protein
MWALFEKISVEIVKALLSVFGYRLDRIRLREEDESIASRIRDVLNGSPMGQSAADIASKINESEDKVRSILNRMLDAKKQIRNSIEIWILLKPMPRPWPILAVLAAVITAALVYQQFRCALVCKTITSKTTIMETIKCAQCRSGWLLYF